MTGPYAYAAPEYWNAGWRSVLPLPPRQKANPPDDYTGWKGLLVPSYADILAWTEDKPNGNVALRLPRGQVGLDIDAYIKNGVQKRGRETLEAAERMWGPLPPTWRSTSRDDGISGIGLYRVVDGLRWPGTFGPGTETIHHGHRYVVAPPSIHDETGKPYRWITPTGEVSQTPPRVDELPWLPTAWVVGITENRPERVLLGAGMTDDDIKAWLANHNHGEHACGPMYDAAARILAGLHDGAHESLAGLMNIVRLAGYGHEGLFTTLGDIRKAFMAEAAPRRDGGERTAAQEWTRSLFGAVDKMVGAGELPESTGGDPCDLGIIEHEPMAPPPMLELPSGDTISDAELEDTPEADDQVEAALNAEQMWRLTVEKELRSLRARQEAKLLLAAQNAPKLELLGIDDLLKRPRPTPLVQGLLYRNSLSRIFGAPGCGKSFVAIDLALRMAMGWEWNGAAVTRGKVIYIMAEGEAVNTERLQAWMDRHRVTADELRGWFQAVPHKVLLTDEGVKPFIDAVREQDVDLVILDTKNRMMLGNENTSEDNAAMIRAVDLVREATGCCALLIDHTGLNATGRAKGDNATEGSMETEAEVTNDKQHPPKITVEVTRDKAREAGAKWEFFLRTHPLEDGTPAAVLLPLGDDVDMPAPRALPGEVARAWMHVERVLPDAVTDYEGPGKAAVPDLAKFMAHDAGAADPDGIGVTRTQAQTALGVRALGGARGHSEIAVRRAWSALRSMGYLAPADGKDGSDGKAENTTGRHVWTARNGLR